MSCPCEDCLCVPICRNKFYFTLFSDCSLITKYAKVDNNNDNKLQITQKILQPQWWKISEENDNITITLGTKRKGYQDEMPM